jgi:nucleoside-diphosphate-sugar epimerase
MVILVTGGAGFLGSTLVQLLLDQGHEVVVLDSLWTSSDSNLDRFRSNKRLRYIQADVRDPIPWIDGVDQIYHLACPASPVHFETQPIDILQTCFIGASNVLDYAVKQNARVLLASTSGTVLLTPTFCLHTLIKSQQRSTATLKLHARMKAIEETSIASALGHVTMKERELWKLWGTRTNSNTV